MSEHRIARDGSARWIVVAAILVAAFFGAYRYAAAQSGRAGSESPTAPGQVAAGEVAAPTSGGCACCGSSASTQNGLTGEVDEAAAVLEGDVQRISVDLSKGYYSPNQIVLKAGVPAEITFGQSSGCTAQVMSEDLGFFEDLAAGSKTVKIAAMPAGEYAFSCGMQMVFGKIVVK